MNRLSLVFSQVVSARHLDFERVLNQVKVPDVQTPSTPTETRAAASDVNVSVDSCPLRDYSEWVSGELRWRG